MRGGGYHTQILKTQRPSVFTHKVNITGTFQNVFLSPSLHAILSAFAADGEQPLNRLLLCKRA
jgi:hypothetical protein